MTEMRNSETDRAYLKRRKIYAVISIIVLVAVFAAATVALWKPLISTFRQPAKFRSWVDAHGLVGRLAFIGIDVLQVIFAIIPGEPMELGAGYAFGALEGTLLCLVGDAIGTTVIFLFVRLLGIKLVETFVSREKIQSMRFLKDAKKLNLLIFLLFFIPGTPKDIFTYVAGLTPIRLGALLILTSVARIPSVLTSTLTGDALGVQNYRSAILIYAITGVVSIVGILIYRRISGRRQGEKGTDAPEKL